jgi:leucyl-tRNA synthetase
MINRNALKLIERFVHEMEKNILNFSLNKCIASIYTLLNYLEKNNIYLGKNELSKKVLICLFPIIPGLSSTLSEKLFNMKSI